jgi:hypothetical protein
MVGQCIEFFQWMESSFSKYCLLFVPTNCMNKNPTNVILWQPFTHYSKQQFHLGHLHPSIHHKIIIKKGGSKGGFPNANYKTSSLCMVVLCMGTTTTKERWFVKVGTKHVYHEFDHVPMLEWSSNLGNFKTKQQSKKLQSQSIC